ncbi:MAG: A/G-specific adenine glycosylase [Lachnospiraceae bacterium]|nr:A/G-specific adenine glycosylase [Lachnospiraceae bacterium]
MLEDFNFEIIVRDVLTWYKENKRDLPWRKNREAYSIWVSEIMLQQTRVEAVIVYYQRFMKELPTVNDLALCEEDKLLKLWEGLGYYNRVRNMQAAARDVMELYDGKVPDNKEDILALKGIGSYTARAILSQAYNQPFAAVDGNVFRVVTRLSMDDTDIKKESFKKQVEKVLDGIMPKEAGEFNQAMMELGATVCVPNGEPHCDKCPVKEVCLARKNHRIMEFPVKSKAKPRKVEDKTVFIIRNEDKILLSKRPGTGLLAGLYEFPNVKGFLNKKECILAVENMGLEPIRVKKLPQAKHIFSHVEWHMKGYEILLDETAGLKGDYLFVDCKDMEVVYSIPAAFEAYKKELNIISYTTKKS